MGVLLLPLVLLGGLGHGRRRRRRRRRVFSLRTCIRVCTASTCARARVRSSGGARCRDVVPRHGRGVAILVDNHGDGDDGRARPALVEDEEFVARHVDLAVAQHDLPDCVLRCGGGGLCRRQLRLRLKLLFLLFLLLLLLKRAGASIVARATGPGTSSRALKRTPVPVAAAHADVAAAAVVTLRQC